MTEQAAPLLILAAHELELSPLRARLQRAGMRVPSAVVGVGMPAAAAGTARALERANARRVLLVGSCGCYPGSGLPLLSLMAVSRTRLIDAATLEGRAALPAAMPQACASDPSLHAELLALPGVRDGSVATTVGITTDDALAGAIAEHSGCGVENLETLAVGLACAARDVAFAALLCCTNQVGAQGRAQWATHHERAAELTAEALIGWIARW